MVNKLRFNIKDRRILALHPLLSVKDAEWKAQKYKTSIFGSVSRALSFVKNQDVILTHTEVRYEPFWYAAGESLVEYEKSRPYYYEVDSKVKKVAINNKIYQIVDGRLEIPAIDTCLEERKKEIFMDAMSGEEKDFRKYFEFKTKTIKQTEELDVGNTVVVPAEVRAEFLIRTMLKDLMATIHADKILEEKLEINRLYLFFRPIYAFEFTLQGKNKKGVIEIDGCTGEVKKKGSVFKRKMSEIFSENVLFEVSTELASSIIPGAGAGVIIAHHYKKKKQQEAEKEEMRKNARKK